MDCDLLIDLGESPNSTVKDSENGLMGPLDSSINAVSHNGVASNSASINSLASDILSEAGAKHVRGKRRVSPFGSPTMKFKAQSVDSLSANNFNGLGVLPLLGSQMAAMRPQSVNLKQLAGEDLSSLLSPFSCPRPRSTPSLPAESLIDAEPSKLLSPFGWTPTHNNQMTINVATQVEDIPIGNLVEVQEPEPTLPDDMFDIDTLGRKQLENSRSQQNAKPPPTVEVLLPSLTSIGSEDMNSYDSLNKGFMESVSDQSNLFPTPDDSVFEEAQGLSKALQQIATEASHLTLDNIEDEDGSIVFDCPDWKEEGIESDFSKPNPEDCVQHTLKMYSKGKTIDKEGGIVMNEYNRKSSSAFSDIVVGSPESGCQSLSFSSSISAISPTPLSSGMVENMKLKARSLIGNQFNAGSLKLRASSCSSMPSSKPGPLKALVPLGQVTKIKSSTPDTLSVHKRSFETSHLQVMNSPVERISVAKRMSSTPKPHTPDNSNINKNKPNHGSSLKKPVGNKINKSEQVCITGTKKSTGTSVVTPRSLSLGKLQEYQKVGTNGVASAKSPSAHPPALLKKLPVGSPAVETSVFPGGSRHNPSPLLRRKISNSPSVMKTPSRSISTGSLSSVSSTKKMYSSPQMPILQTHGRSNSMSSKLPLCHKGLPLAEASVNSPAKHSSPLNKLVLKFRRNLGPKEMKENVHPM